MEQIDTKLNKVAVGPQRRLQLRLAQVRKREGEKKGVLVRHGRRRVEVKDATEERDEASLRGEEIDLAHLCAKEKGGHGYIGVAWWLHVVVVRQPYRLQMVKVRASVVVRLAPQVDGSRRLAQGGAGRVDTEDLLDLRNGLARLCTHGERQREG